MSIDGRLRRLEGNLGDAVLWRECQRHAREFGMEPEALFEDASRGMARYDHLLVPGPDGKVVLEPFVRAMAEGEGLEYGLLLAETRRVLRRLARRRR